MWFVRKLSALALHLEALGLLLWARILIAFVPMKRWRASLGRCIDAADPILPLPHGQKRRAARIIRAVHRVARVSPVQFVCLPKSMAGQWMLRRRRIASGLVFGVGLDSKDDDDRPLHAWIEIEGREVPAADSQTKYARGLHLHTDFYDDNV